MAIWGFYGRSVESRLLGEILDRNRWFFLSITGRRRIGKTRLIQEVRRSTARPIFYVQIPDSDDAGVITAVQDALEAFDIPTDQFAPPHNLASVPPSLKNRV